MGVDHAGVRGVVAGTVDPAQPAVRHGSVEGGRTGRWADAVEPAVQQQRRHLRQRGSLVEQRRRAEPAAVAQVVALDAVAHHQGVDSLRIGLGGGCGCAAGEPLFVAPPPQRGPACQHHVIRLERLEQRLGVPPHRRRRPRRRPGAPGTGRAAAARTRHRERIERMGHGQRRAPRAAHHQPALDAQVRTHAAQVGKQVGQACSSCTLPRRSAEASATLVDADDAKAFRVEKAAQQRRKPRAWPAVQHDHGQTPGGARLLHMDLVPARHHEPVGRGSGIRRVQRAQAGAKVQGGHAADRIGWCARPIRPPAIHENHEPRMQTGRLCGGPAPNHHCAWSSCPTPHQPVWRTPSEGDPT